MILIIQIAIGIVLAVLILRYLHIIMGLGILSVVLVGVVLLLIAAIYWASGVIEVVNNNEHFHVGLDALCGFLRDKLRGLLERG